VSETRSNGGWRWPNITRDSVLFVFGLGGIVHEAYIRTGATRPEFIMLFAAMCGLPVALRRDEKKAEAPSDDRPAVEA
jgi:hypothetical protein